MCRRALCREITYQPGPNGICCLSEHDKGQLTLHVSVYVCFRTHVCMLLFIDPPPPFCVTCVSEGTSLEEQVRRIKDIEAIESDSFVPQAFKSSRDDIKVRSVSLSFPAPHSLYLSLRLLLNSPLCKAVPSVQRQPRPNQTFLFSAICSNLRRFIRRFTLCRLQSGSARTAVLSVPLPLPPLSHY